MNDGGFVQTILGLERTTKNIIENNLQIPDFSASKQTPEKIVEMELFDATVSGDVWDGVLALTPSQDNHSGFSANFGAEFMFERVWVQPLLIALAFIVEDAQREIKIWNSYRTKAIQLTNVVVTGQEGTLLEYPTPLPDTIALFGGTSYTLTVYKAGPPLQDTTYRLTIDGTNFDIDITGIRVLPWTLDLNWDDNPEVNYEFTSTIFTTEKLKEQRRALCDESWQSFIGSYDASGDRARIIVNTIAYGKDKVFGVPIFTEKMHPTLADQDGFTIVVEEDFTYFWHMQNTGEYIILVDHTTGEAEIKEVASLTGSNQINLNQAISNAFNLATTYCYPCLFCIIKSFRGSQLTDDFDEVKIDFREFKNAG